MPILQVKHLSKSYGKIAALRDVSFDVQPGELLALIGPNGAGKSTLFDCMAGLLPADSGSVTPPNQLFYVPDGISPWPAQPLSWALDFAIGYFGGRPELRADVVQQLDLKPFLHQPIGALSKGQRKRGLLAMGLLTPHPILLIDEPLDGLDLRQMRDVAQVLQHHAAAGRTLFLSIHQIADAARFCHRFILLSSGEVRGEGSLETLTALARSRDNSRPYDNLEEVFLALT